MTTVTHTNIQVISPRGRRETERSRNIFKEIMAENFPHLMENIKPQVKEAEKDFR